MKRLEHMKCALMDCVMGQMGNLKEVNTKELGEAVDMIKDLSEAIYYCTITEAMNHKSEGESNGTSFTDDYFINEYNRKGSSHYQSDAIKTRDPREGRSYISRRMYIESKEMGKDKLSNIQDLEHYMRELSEDITEMIENASIEEKQLIQKKLNMLAQKITNG